MSRALVTGATGLVGFNIVEALRRRGAEIRCLARSPEAARGILGDGVEIVPGDLLDEASIHDAVRGYYDTVSLGVSAGLGQSGEGKTLLGPYRNLGKNARDEVEMTLGRAFRDGAFVQRLTTEILRACR